MRVSRRNLLAAAGATLAGPSVAQSAFPSRPLSIVVPYTAGSSSDILARLLAPHLGNELGQLVIVENRAGAGGTVGADYVAKSAPDGTTLLMGVTGSNAIAQALYPRLPYDVLKDFAPVSMVVSSPLVVTVNPAVKATLTDVHQTDPAPKLGTAVGGIK